MYPGTPLKAEKPSYLVEEVITQGLLYLQLDTQLVDAIKKKINSFTGSIFLQMPTQKMTMFKIIPVMFQITKFCSADITSGCKTHMLVSSFG